MKKAGIIIISFIMTMLLSGKSKERFPSMRLKEPFRMPVRNAWSAHLVRMAKTTPRHLLWILLPWKIMSRN